MSVRKEEIYSGAVIKTETDDPHQILERIEKIRAKLSEHIDNPEELKSTELIVKNIQELILLRNLRHEKLRKQLDSAKKMYEKHINKSHKWF